METRRALLTKRSKMSGGREESLAATASKKNVVVILPTVREADSREGDGTRSPSSSASEFAAEGANYPMDLLGVSWGSYLHSTPPSRSDGSGASAECSPENEKETESGNNGEAVAANEPHPLLLQLGELMREIVKSKEELAKCGFETSSLGSVSDLSLESQYAALQMTLKGSTDPLGQVIAESQLLESVIKYVRDVLEHLVEQGKTTVKQSHFLQRTARKLNENHQKTLNEQKSIQLEIREDRAKLDEERQELEKEKMALLEDKVELKRVLHEAEVKLKERERMTRKMDSPHTIAQGQSQLIALSKTQKQQLNLEKTFSRQMRDLKSLQQAHDQTRAELLAAKEQATRLHHRLARQVHDIKSSEASMANKFEVSRAAHSNPVLAMDREKKRKSYQGISQAQITATLRNITTAHRNLCRDIERMQRKLSQQQTAGIKVSRHMEDTHAQMSKTSSEIKQHSKLVGSRGLQNQASNTPTNKLPKISQPKPKPQHRKSSFAKDFSLPHIELSRRTITGRVANSGRDPVIIPPYQFSKDELHTLANFHSHKSAKEVTEWLQIHGQLIG